MKKFRRKKQSTATEAPNRITNETVAEHRERILAGGRRFKYPVQYAKHRLVINTIVISIIALLAIIVVVWWQLYPSQNTSTFLYRITRVLPLPVATVDGQNVRYSDYLVGFRSQEHYLQVKEGVDLYSNDNKSRLDWVKRLALDDAVADSYAAKLAKEKGISITEKQVDDALQRQRQSRDGTTSQEAYDAIILDHFNWSPDEARQVTARELLRQEVSYRIDTVAAKQREDMMNKLKTEKDFDKVAAAVSVQGDAKVQSSITPLVPGNNQDGGLAERASRLTVGQVSEAFRSSTGDGYYVVKLLEKDKNGRVSYAALKVPLTIFDAQLKKVKADGKIKEFISVPETRTSIFTQ